MKTTKPQIETIEKLLLEGKTLIGISKILEIPKSSLGNIINDNCICGGYKKVLETRKLEIIKNIEKLLKQGYTKRRIANLVKINYNTVTKYMHEYNLCEQYLVILKSKELEIVNNIEILLKIGKPLYAISKILGIYQEKIRNYIRDYNICGGNEKINEMKNTRKKKEIKKYIDQGLSIPEIGEAVKNAGVVKLMKKYKLLSYYKKVRNNKKKLFLIKIESLLRQGKNGAQIAKELRSSPSSIGRFIREYNFEDGYKNIMIVDQNYIDKDRNMFIDKFGYPPEKKNSPIIKARLKKLRLLKTRAKNRKKHFL